MPIRTGDEPSYPGSHSSSSSGRRRSPERPYMIWICGGAPATARNSQSRQARASPWYPALKSASSVKVASRSQQ